jgi:hypothetical protein
MISVVHEAFFNAAAVGDLMYECQRSLVFELQLFSLP